MVCIQGIKAKRERRLNALKKVEAKNENFIQNLYFGKGGRRAVIGVYTDCYDIRIFTCPDYWQHVDWNDKDFKAISGNEKVRLIDIVSQLNDIGYKLLD